VNSFINLSFYKLRFYQNLSLYAFGTSIEKQEAHYTKHNMFRNYLKTALRNLTRQKGSTMINIAGLTLGITASLVLFLMVVHFSSFDKFHSKRDRIYRVVNQSDGNQGKDYQAGVPAVLPDAFRTDFPEAEQVVFTSYRANSLVTIPQRAGESKKYQEERGVVYTEPSFFKIFDRNVLIGDAIKGLDEPNEAIVSSTLAKKYFGKEDAIGEVLKFEDRDYKVTAVVEDAPSTTDFPFDLFLSYSTVKREREEPGWHSIWSDEQCYFLLKDGERIASLESRLPAFGKKYLGENDFDKTEFMFQPLSEIHYDDRFDVYSYNTTPKGVIYTFGVIALVLIITACINFINLATAEAIKRSKEVGVRKSLGSTQGQLVRQFLGETTLVTLISVFASVGLTQIVLSFLNPFLDLKLSLDFGSSGVLWIYLGSITLVVSLLSGLYPAFVTSGFSPALVLKNQINNKNSSSYLLRRILVVFQFVISQFLIILTIVIIYQMNYSQTKDLGFSKDAILFVPIPERETPLTEGTGVSKMKTLRDEMLKVTGVENASLANTPPSSGNVSGTNFSVEGITDEFGTQVKQIDGNYLDLYKLELVEGHNVLDGDTAVGFLVNEKLTSTVGLKNPKEIIGKNLTMWGRTLPVVGVVKDFHTVSIRQPIEATVMMNRIRGFENLALKVDMRRTQDVIATLKDKWEASYPDHLFEYTFLDESIGRFYEGERKMSILLSVFTSMAIFIGCLGLFGLATFMANQKTKEIGVRKVLGASVESIVMMFSKEYLKLIVIGFVIAAPIGYLAMNAFLEEFAYKIELGPGIFILGLSITLVIALLTVGYKSLKAAVVNPVKSLRYE
jgi:putative ABC transport system permease protein